MTSLKEFLRHHLAYMPIDYGKMTHDMAVAALRVLQEESDDMASRYIKELRGYMVVDMKKYHESYEKIAYGNAITAMLKFLKGEE